MPVPFTTLPISARAGISGRHIVSCGVPATKPCDELVSGNGTLKISGTGRPENEILVLRREELEMPQWAEPPRAPLIADQLPEVRRLILDGKYVEAAKLASRVAVERGTLDTAASNPRHSALQLLIQQPVREAKNYLSTLDLRTSLITTRWQDHGVTTTRELFASRADDVAAVRIRANRGGVSLVLQGQFVAPVIPKVRVLGCNYVPGGVDTFFTGDAIPPEVTVRHGEQSILASGVYAYQKGGFSVAVRLAVTGGKVRHQNDQIYIENADSVVLLMTARRNYGSQPQHDDDQLLSRLNDLDADFDRLLARHVAIHQPLFDRVSIDLGGDPSDYLLTSAELRQKQFLTQATVPAFAEMMVDRGRFFLLNECGKFPPIYGHVNININHQLSAGNIGALPEMMESFFRWIEWQLPDARDNAKRILGTRGFFIACHPDQESGRLFHFHEYYPHHYWTASSGWCLQPFLEYYQCTGDEAFLRNRMIPLYKELFLLYADFLSVRDEQGRRMFIPSYSPENFPDNVPCQAVINATMDLSVCREVLQTLLDYAPLAGAATESEIAQWRTLLDELPPYLYGAHGELKEWARHDLEDHYDHRHSSHLYGAFPSHEFQPELNAEAYQGAFIANRMRAFGNESFHGIGHRAQAAARLKDPWLVNSMLRLTLESGFVTDSFATVHNPYLDRAMPDAQGALPSIILESLFYSRPGFLEVLPALPRDSFFRGSVKGILARSFAVVDELSWDQVAGWISLTVTSGRDQEVTVCLRAPFQEFSWDGGPGQTSQASMYHQVHLTGGTPSTMKWTGVRFQGEINATMGK